jgi:hypothetical protein
MVATPVRQAVAKAKPVRVFDSMMSPREVAYPRREKRFRCRGCSAKHDLAKIGGLAGRRQGYRGVITRLELGDDGSGG